MTLLMKALLTKTQRLALGLIVKHGPVSCANLGDSLWGSRTHRGGSNCSCPFARPAGVVVKALVGLELVERCRVQNDVRTLYVATRKGREAVK